MSLRKTARDLVRRIPLLRVLQRRSDQPATKNKREKTPFPGSRAYWETRYADGGNSGVGSYSKFADFKASILNSFIIDNDIRSTIEFGCGDGNQLSSIHYPRYVGLDVSETAIKLCIDKFKGDETKSFRTLDLYAGEVADLSVSLDVIYHLIADEDFEHHMNNLFTAATRFVIIYSSDTDNNNHTDEHVKHRHFTKWVDCHIIGWSLSQHIANKYPYNGDYRQSSFSDFYVYKKDISDDSPHTATSALLP